MIRISIDRSQLVACAMVIIISNMILISTSFAAIFSTPISSSILIYSMTFTICVNVVTLLLVSILTYRTLKNNDNKLLEDSISSSSLSDNE